MAQIVPLYQTIGTLGLSLTDWKYMNPACSVSEGHVDYILRQIRGREFLFDDWKECII